MPFDPTNRPLAAPGLNSYRCRNRYGWTMIGAHNHSDAMREAKRTDEGAKPEDLQIWNGFRYVPVDWSAWRIEQGSYGQGLTLRVCRGLGDAQADVWGHYRQDEMNVALSALERAQAERPS